MLRQLTRSLSFRLLAIFIVMGLLFAYGALLGIRWVYATDGLRELVSGHLTLHVDYVRRDIGSPPSIENALEIARKVPVDIRITGPGIDWASDERFPEFSLLEFDSGETINEEAGAWLRDVEGVEFATYGAHGFLKIDQGPYAIVVSSPKISDPVEERQLTPIIMGFGLFLVLLAYLAVRWLFRPIGAIRRGAAQIGGGNFQHRITAVRADQLGDLAGDINKMAGDVQAMLDAKRQLLLGISHELRSPLSRLKLAIELADDSATDGMASDVSEMEKIIATLLEAERLAGRHAVLRVSRITARELVEGLISDYFERARARLRVSLPEDDWINVDEARFTLLLKNLISNALRYTEQEASPVCIEFTKSETAWQLAVRDEGPGISPEQIPHIGQPFFRIDPSRTRGTGGSGLGLYLARMVAEAHGGTLQLDTYYKAGARFVVTIPFEPMT